MMLAMLEMQKQGSIRKPAWTFIFTSARRKRGKLSTGWSRGLSAGLDLRPEQEEGEAMMKSRSRI